MRFTDEEIERYARHLVLREVGGPGQQKLKAAGVLIVGAGGLGSHAALYLAAAGESERRGPPGGGAGGGRVWFRPPRSTWRRPGSGRSSSPTRTWWRVRT